MIYPFKGAKSNVKQLCMYSGISIGTGENCGHVFVPVPLDMTKYSKPIYKTEVLLHETK